MFFGAYAGDTDTGSNRMKEWFWNQKITPTIKSTPNEPLVEINIATDLRPITPQDNTQAVCAAWFADNPVARWGVEVHHDMKTGIAGRPIPLEQTGERRQLTRALASQLVEPFVREWPMASNATRVPM